jgi:hypothetical protein
MFHGGSLCISQHRGQPAIDVAPARHFRLGLSGASRSRGPARARTDRGRSRFAVSGFHNARKHGFKIRGCDPYSSARYFDGWSKDPELEPTDCDEPPVAPATLHLLKKGWRYHGLIDPDETPRSAQR